MKWAAKNPYVSSALAIILVLVLLGTAAGLIISGTRQHRKSCWVVVDTAGVTWEFETKPQFNIQVQAIPFEKDGRAGWVWPASVSWDTRCDSEVSK